MKKANLIHPRKLKKAMSDFILDVFVTENFTREITSFTKEEFDQFLANKISAPKHEVVITPKLVCKDGFDNFGVLADQFFEDTEIDTVEFWYDPKALTSNGSRNYYRGLGYVMADMGHRANYMKGFSQITRILLHEIGHIMTHEVILIKYTKQELDDLRSNRPQHDNKTYIKLPDEWAATQWAIDWLADPNHRKIARDFEKKFWICFS